MDPPVSSPKTVLVTGAGFSTAWGYPLTSELTGRLLREAELSPAHDTAKEFTTIGVLQRFLEKIPDDHEYQENFERLLTDVFSAKAAGARLTLPGLDIQDEDADFIAEMLLWGLGLTLIRVTHAVGIDADTFMRRSMPGLRAIALFRQVAAVLAPLALVTVNYDLVPEEWLAPGVLFDYSLGSRVRLATRSLPGKLPPNDFAYSLVQHQPFRPEGGRVLKLHGSLNWCYCAECRLPIVFRKKVAFDSVKGTFDFDNFILPEMAWQNTSGYWFSFHRKPGARQVLSQCGHQLRPLMIPPLENKDSLPEWELLAPVWSMAREMLRGCEQVVLAGCGVRSADRDLQGLLSLAAGKRVCMIGGRRSGAQARMESLVGPVTYLGDDVFDDGVAERIKVELA